MSQMTMQRSGEYQEERSDTLGAISIRQPPEMVEVPRVLFDVAMRLADEMAYATNVAERKDGSFSIPRVQGCLQAAMMVTASLPSNLPDHECFSRWHALRDACGWGHRSD